MWPWFARLLCRAFEHRMVYELSDYTASRMEFAFPEPGRMETTVTLHARDVEVKCRRCNMTLMKQTSHPASAPGED